MIHYMKRAYFTRVFDNIGFKCKIICHLKISAIAGLETERGIISNGVNLSAEFNATTGLTFPMLQPVKTPSPMGGKKRLIGWKASAIREAPPCRRSFTVLPFFKLQSAPIP